MKFTDIMGQKKSNTKRVRMNFSLANANPIEMVERVNNFNFSDNSELALKDYELYCFSLLERIRLSKLSPRQILKRRLNEVVRYVNGHNIDNIKENRDEIVRYLSEYVFSVIVKIMYDPKITQINLILTLGLPAILKDLKSVRELQIYLRRTKMELGTKGYMSKLIQDRLSDKYTNFWREFIKSVEEKYFSESKRGVLLKSQEDRNALI